MRFWRRWPALFAGLTLIVGVIAGGSVANATVTGESTSAPSALLAAAAAVPPASAVAWGSNDAGQLGTGATVDSSPVPVAVSSTGVLSGKTISAVSSGAAHACAVSSGAAFCWGLNSGGQLGDGTKTDSNIPVPVAVTSTGVLAGKSVTAVSAGFAHTCAIADGAAYCWGSNADGVLGDGTTTDSATPVTVGGALTGQTVTAISAGRSNTCAVAGGKAYCWGYNGFGALGNGGTADSLTPVAVSTAGVLAGLAVSAISVGPLSETAVCAIADSRAYCWGANAYGAVGNGTTGATPQPTPVAVTGALADQPVTDISVAGYSACAVAGGAAYCWGLNEFGELGNNSTVNSATPVAVDGSGVLAGKTVTAISAGAQITGNKVHPAFGHACVVASGDPVCWGANQYGQLGATTTGPSTVPVAVDTTDALQGRKIVDISSGALFTTTVTAGPTGPAPGSFSALSPVRIMDTRLNLGSTGPVPAWGTTSLQVLGQGGVPASGVSAVVLNVTVADPQSSGNITVWPSGQPRQETSNLNFQVGQNIPNLVMVPVGADGKVQLYNQSAGALHLVADVAGYILGG